MSLAPRIPVLHFYFLPDCPHCIEARPIVLELASRRDLNLRVELHDVSTGKTTQHMITGVPAYVFVDRWGRETVWSAGKKQSAAWLTTKIKRAVRG